MEEFSKDDYKVLHILATYINENFINPNIKNALSVTPSDVYNYKFYWDNFYSDFVTKKFASNKIIVPRYLTPRFNNTKLEAILQYGYKIFKLIDDQKQQNEHWFKYIINKLLLRSTKNEYTYDLVHFFRTLQIGNKQLLSAYSNYPEQPVEWDKVDRAFISNQSHIFIISALFEIYHPLSAL